MNQPLKLSKYIALFLAFCFGAAIQAAAQQQRGGGGGCVGARAHVLREAPRGLIDVTEFDEDTALELGGDGVFRGTMTDRWWIGCRTDGPI